jgi:predicted HAD superfamily phosphohydrolase
MSFNPEELSALGLQSSELAALTPFDSEEKEILEMSDESGREYALEVISTFAIEDRKYLATIPVDESDFDLIHLEAEILDEDVQGFCILRWDQDEEGEDILVEVLDPDELDEVKETLSDLGA